MKNDKEGGGERGEVTLRWNETGRERERQGATGGGSIATNYKTRHPFLTDADPQFPQSQSLKSDRTQYPIMNHATNELNSQMAVIVLV